MIQINLNLTSNLISKSIVYKINVKILISGGENKTKYKAGNG